jgi:hypothetical protein
MSEPTYQTPEDEFLFGSIGRLTISWALLEAGLDGIITIIHHRVGGKTIEADMPWMLKRKIKYIRKCFSRLDPLKPYSTDVPSLLDEILNASEMRQNIIHGVAMDHPEGATTLKMAKLIRGGEFYEAHHFEVSSTEILASAVAALRLSTRVGALAKVMIAAFGVDKFQQTTGKFTR